MVSDLDYDRVAEDADVLSIMEDFELFCSVGGIRQSVLTGVLKSIIDKDEVNTPLSCVAVSTPPQEGKTTFIVYYLSWMLIRNPWLKIIYATYSQGRANSVSRQIRSLVSMWTPLKSGSSSVQRWETEQGGGLLAAGRGSAMVGFSSDLTVIDDPIKDMVEAQSGTIREQTVEWFSSVVMTRMASLSQIIVIATRWHNDDLIAHVVANVNATYTNIPAQAISEDDLLGRHLDEYLDSVQGRSKSSWDTVKKAVGPYVWQALYQGDPKPVGGSLINVDKIDIIPWETVVYQDERTKAMMTLDRAVVVQSWDLTFGTIDGKKRKSSGADYVAGHVYALIGTKWILVDRVHDHFTFTETVSQVLRMSARWPQTSRIYVEKKANGVALLNTLRKRAALIRPVEPRGSKEARALAVQPTIDDGDYAVLDTIFDQGMFDEYRVFPFGKHDDDVDAMTQAINNGRSDYFMMGN